MYATCKMERGSRTQRTTIIKMKPEKTCDEMFCRGMQIARESERRW
jgi:hypothetical protein